MSTRTRTWRSALPTGSCTCAEREERTEEKRPEGYCSEFHYGSFARKIRLPEGATEADVSATYKDGILEVRVPAPKDAAVSARAKIPISRG